MEREQDTPNVEGIDELLDRERPAAWIAENPGGQLVGTLVRYDTGESQYGPADIAVVRTPEGERAVWLFGTALKNQFGKVAPKPGEVIGVKYLGERTSAAGNKYKDWRVVVDRPDVLPDFDAWADEVEN